MNFFKDDENWKISYEIKYSIHNIPNKIYARFEDKENVCSFLVSYVSIKRYDRYSEMFNTTLKLHMTSFYNYFQKELKPIFELVSETMQQKIKGLSYSLLRHILNYYIINNMIRTDDYLVIEASDSNYKHVLNLYEFYKSIGFKANDEYVNNYKKIVSDIDSGKYTEDEYYNIFNNKYNNYNYEQLFELEDRLENGDITQEQFYGQKKIIDKEINRMQIEYPNLMSVPMIAKISDLLDVCKVKSKHQLIIFNDNEDEEYVNEHVNEDEEYEE